MQAEIKKVFPIRNEQSSKGEFSEELLAAVQEMGLDLEIVSDPKDASFSGYFIER
jgi:hypothetical protein